MLPFIYDFVINKVTSILDTVPVIAVKLQSNTSPCVTGIGIAKGSSLFLSSDTKLGASPIAKILPVGG
jgi:hypothetical protein